MSAPFTLEELFTSPQGFAVPATAVQRAITRVIDGRSLDDLAEHPDVLASLGIESATELPTTAPTEVDLLAGIQCGKTMLAAARAVQATQTVDLTGVAIGLIPRVSCLSIDLDKAQVFLDHVVGTVQARPALRALLVEEPTRDSVLLRHPSGRAIEIKCVAGSRAGGSVVSRPSAGLIFDEYPRMLGSADGAVVNFNDARSAGIGRLLPGATVLAIGSPWAPIGPAFERFVERHGKPTADHVVIRARGDWLNPTWWTPKRIETVQRSDDIAFHTDYLSEFADPSESFILQSEIKRATRDEPMVLPPSTRPRKYICGIDPGTRGNGFAMVLLAAATHEGTVKYEVVMVKEWRGTPSAPLSPWETFVQIKNLIEAYGGPLVVSDQHNADPNKDICRRLGIKLHEIPITAQNRSGLFETLKGTFAAGTIEIPPDKTLARDLASIRRRLTVTGITYDLPRTGDGRHADTIPALCLALEAMGNSEDARAAARAAESARRNVYIMALAGGRDLTLPVAPEYRTEALIALANGADPEAVFNPIGYARGAGRDWRHGGGEERGARAHDEQLRRIGSTEWSGYRAPPGPTDDERAALADLEARVLKRVAGAK